MIINANFVLIYNVRFVLNLIENGKFFFNFSLGKTISKLNNQNTFMRKMERRQQYHSV